MTAAALQPVPFQVAAVAHIVRRLGQDSRRFLLADEVGLGKTIVARGVIETLAARRRREPLRVIYVCSNAEIARQNREKLVTGGGQPVGRVTELALKHSLNASPTALYALTPGTSLREGTGLAWERRLLLYCMHRIYGEPVWTGHWREFFRCTAGEEGWSAATTERALRAEYERRTSEDLQRALAAAWAAYEEEGERLPAVVRRGVAEFNPDSAIARGRRNHLVGRLRGILQRVALSNLRADLVILDEVQRFRDLLDEARNPQHIAAQLFGARVPVLILSATPYRLLTLDHEVAGTRDAHHAQFYETLGFLFDTDQSTPARIRRNLAAFGDLLRHVQPTGPPDIELLNLKRSLEDDLRKVVCRTERNWYVLDHRKGVEEGEERVLAYPQAAELGEYFRLHRALGPAMGGNAQVTEFWKSAPSLLTFLDASYVLQRRLRAQHIRVPSALITPAADVHELARRNHRMSSVVALALGADAAHPRLWTAPSYTYYKDEFFGAEPPRKLLVFSGWRFVPKSIAIIASHVAEQRLGRRPKRLTQPLKFSDRASFHVFDSCFPSPALAKIVNPRASLGRPGVATATSGDLLNQASIALEAALTRARVSIGGKGGSALWRVVMRLEATGATDLPVRGALRAWQSGAEQDEPSVQVERHKKLVEEWLGDQEAPLRISHGGLRKLALIAAFSPAICLLRALYSVHEARDVDAELPAVLDICLGPLRRYFNRAVVQRIIRRHRPRTPGVRARVQKPQTFAERVLRYAADAHLQAVLDEFTYLLRSSGHSIGSSLMQLGEIWSLAGGTPRTNGRGRGELVRIVPDSQHHTTHFAQAFGEDVTRDQVPGKAATPVRKSILREAFNSPFWPFVLATTSVGQEGLDFHLYCRDVLHWNLPSNPVDLEQREGRVNRRDGLAVRTSIARDWPLTEPQLAPQAEDPRRNPWTVVFEHLAQHDDPQRYKHGLYPHWIYECSRGARSARIRRHVPMFSTSRDARRYERLKTGLALYRLVFGQANQEDLLDRLRERLLPLAEDERADVLRRLAGYMLNLSPINRTYALRQAVAAASDMVNRPDAAARVAKLLSDVARMRDRHAAPLDGAAADVARLVERVELALAAGTYRQKQLRRALVALEYLRNPYDQMFDLAVEHGFEDDLGILRQAARPR